MDSTQWIIFILVVQVIHFLGTWKLYVKAGRKAWEAAIPIYNGIVLMQIIRRPKWWVLLLFIPIINLLMFPVVWVETIRSFGKNSLLDTWLVILSLGFYTYYINYTQDVTYVEERDTNPRTAVGEWVSSIVFAVVAATLVHTYFIQPYVIPTGSLEKTLLIGDFLFVSKFHYGARVPMTTVAAPMVHDTIPLIAKRSYLDKPQLPYLRLPGFQKIKRNEIVVFSWPADTVRQFYKKEKGVRKPIDKKSNYVKRCVGIPGDTLSIVDGFVHINGKQTILPDREKTQYTYNIYGSKGVSSRLLKEVGTQDYFRVYVASNFTQQQNNILGPFIRSGGKRPDGKWELRTDAKGFPMGAVRQARIQLVEEAARRREANLTKEMAATLRKSVGIDSVIKIIQPKGEQGGNVFPHDSDYSWNIDNFGPMYIPQKGATIPLNLKVFPLYKRILRLYEGNTVGISGNKVTINGEIAESYTFKQDYYWMMGDNRHRSEDSRIWGFVPADHIVGKPVFIWMSIDGINDGIKNWSFRWDRFFTTVGGDGEPRSYFRYFLFLLAAYFVFDFFRKKRKKKTAN